MSDHAIVVVTRRQVGSSDVQTEMRCEDCDLPVAEYPVAGYVILQCPNEPPPNSGEWLKLNPGDPGALTVDFSSRCVLFGQV